MRLGVLAGKAMAAAILSLGGAVAAQPNVIDLVPGPSGAYPRRIESFGGDIYFGTLFSSDLVRTDGTLAGTRISGLKNVAGMDRSAGRLFIRDGNGLGVTRGNPATTTYLGSASLPSATLGATNSISIGGVLYFRAKNGTFRDIEVWRTDGTAGGTRQLVDLVPGSGSSFPGNLAALGNRLVWIATTPATGHELFISDGVDSQLIIDLNPGAGDGAPQAFRFQPVAVGDRLYFQGDDGTGEELWATDGTEAGTFKVVDLSSRSSGSNPSEFVPYAGGLLFQATGEFEAGLFFTDGTAAGTVLLAPYLPRGKPVVLEDKAYFIADDRVNGSELWVTDGTAAGTGILVEPNPGPGDSVRQGVSPVALGNRHIYFAADDGTNGEELWVSDGTAAGTRMVADLEPGAGSSRPTYIAATHDGRLVFTATTTAHGGELWVYRPDHARAIPVGASCGAGASTLRCDDPVLGARITARGEGAPAGSMASLLLGLHGAPAPLSRRCALHLDLASAALLGMATTDASGRWELALDVPAAASIAGIDFSIQAILAPTGAPLGGDITNGVILTPGS